jgi:hypothetical protein
MFWLRNEWKSEDETADFLGSSKEIHTQSELTRLDLDCESSNA